jgi:hypothetical protein
VKWKCEMEMEMQYAISETVNGKLKWKCKMEM